jgi:hypothetical protein
LAAGVAARGLAVGVAAIVFGVAGLSAAALGAGGAQVAAERLPIVGPGRAGEILLGDRVAALHKRHLIGRLRPGCELDPGQRVAPLRPPLEGVAVFGNPRNEVQILVVEGGAETVQGIGVGSSAGQARKAYPKAAFDPPRTLKPFLEGFLWVNSRRKPRMTFTFDPNTSRVSAISVPFPNLCE